jgi:glycosyltransferase involved in cell wall biosynthesis
MDTIVKSTPTITVLMPVFNCELYIKEAVDSILNQTYTDFEFIIIDDASTDGTVSIIKSYNDVRIQLIEKSINSGYTNSLNQGLKLAKGKYIARMDGDDISLPERFEKQVAYLEANPDVTLCGTCFTVIGSDVVIQLPENHEAIKLAMLRGNCIAHPTVVIRKEVLDELPMVYNVSKEPAEDYDLWVRVLSLGKLYNLQEVLLKYREHDTQVSQKRQEQQIQSALESRIQMLKYLNCVFDSNETILLKKIMQRSVILTFDEITSFIVLKEKMIKGNSNYFFDSNGFQEYLSKVQRSVFNNYFFKRESYSPVIFLYYFGTLRKHDFKLKFKDEIKLIIKSLICFKRK